MNATRTPPPPKGDGMTLSTFCEGSGVTEWNVLWAWKMGVLELQLRNGGLFITHQEIERQKALSEARRRAMEG